jgi:hypothetical protein
VSRVASSLIPVLLLVVALGLVLTTPEPPDRVLFVGNSYTHYNDMPAMVERLAGSVDRKIDAAMRAPAAGGGGTIPPRR